MQNLTVTNDIYNTFLDVFNATKINLTIETYKDLAPARRACKAWHKALTVNDTTVQLNVRVFLNR